MKLKDKGPITPPPVLTGIAQNVSVQIQAWPSIVSATHWQFGNPTVVDGADFYVGESELGHIHLHGEIHIPTTRDLHGALLRSGLAESFRWAANWVQFQITDESSAEHALWLFGLGYDRIVGKSEEELLERIRAVSSDQKLAGSVIQRLRFDSIAMKARQSHTDA
jgi:hypothetical protein